VEIVVDDLTGPQIASFLDEHVRQMLSITPPESKHALDLDMLRGPGITFWSVMDGGTVVGCVSVRADARYCRISAASSAIDANRLSRFFSRQRFTTASSAVSTPGRSSESGRGEAFNTRAHTSEIESPSNGKTPETSR
jgi:putative acetyltransferase